MAPSRYPCDLHCHTTRSDGNDTPQELIDNAAAQEHQIAMLWQTIDKLSAQREEADCVPGDAARSEHFEAAKLNELVGK